MKIFPFIGAFIVLTLVGMGATFFVIIIANGVTRRIDDLTMGYLCCSGALTLVLTLVAGGGAIALSSLTKWSLWLTTPMTILLTAVVEFIGLFVVFFVVGAALGSF